MTDAREPKLLILDIENSPLVAYSWGPMHDTNLVQVVEESKILSFSAKWLGGKQTTIGLNTMGEKELLLKLWALLDEADIVCGHNSNNFDLKKINARFLKYGIHPPSPFQTADTYLEAKKILSAASLKLDYLGKYLGIGEKMKHEGFALWESCMAGDERAWKRMLKYNAQDVRLTEKLYLKLRPFMKTHPNVGAYLQGVVCPKCGSKRLQSRGYVRTIANMYGRFHCQSCGGWGRYAVSEKRFKSARNA